VNVPQSKLFAWRWHLAILLGAAAQSAPASAQQAEPYFPAQPRTVHWWQGAVVAGGLTGLMLLDRPAQHFFQDNRSSGSDRVASTFRHGGQPEIYGTITLGLVGAGLLAGDGNLTRTGGRLAATLALAGASASLTKVAFGRPRPDESRDVDGFVPFSGQDAMPSGHTTMAFALATALADDIRRPWATVGLYAVATGVAWSRLNDNRHWLSDVSAGAVLGTAAAKVMNGHWRIFHLHPPRFLLAPQQAGLAWQIEF
jgi:membrane-associated phospholipid phosphatase